MANPPTITRSWFDVGGPQPSPGEARVFWTWGQVRCAVIIDGLNAVFEWGYGSHTVNYSPAEAQERLFRGIPFGVNGTFISSAQPPPSTDIDWYFFWGGIYETPPESGNFVIGIGAGLDDQEIGLILDGAQVSCQNISFTTSSSARDPSSPNGQLIGSLPQGTNPGNVQSIILSF